MAKIIIVNFLTLIRIIGTIILIPLYNLYGGLAAGLTSMICYLTDSIDGVLARKWRASTFFGAAFDGVADKLFTIINFIVLYMITPFAIIPIIIEILIILVQVFKFNRNLNIQSSMIGKAKVWVLAICVVATFFVTDINSINILSLHFKEYILSIDASRLYFYLLLPAIIMEVLSLISYILEIIFPENREILHSKPKKIETPKLKGKEKYDSFKSIWLNPVFYEEHKNDTNLRDLRKISKSK